MKRISVPIESTMANKKCGSELFATDFLVVGSGYGGAVAALRLASDQPGREVVVLERGKEYGLGDFPYDVEDIPSHVRLVRETGDDDGNGYADALFNIYVGSKQHLVPQEGEPEDNSVTDVLVGSGLGGTSLINANVAEVPLPHVFRKSAWPQEFRDNPAILANAFQQVRTRIGVTTRTSACGKPFPKYKALRLLGQELGCDAQAAVIAVTTGTARNAVGVQQNPCTDCGNCVTGCNVGAKNTLDRNLLRLAKSRGATFYTGATVQTVEPIEPPDSEGYRWKICLRATVQPQGTLDAHTYCIRARNVILAAGTLGSTEILLRSREAHGLGVSDMLGKKFSTNGDGIIMSYGQQKEVGAIARAAQKNPLNRVGPTITGIIRTGELSIEDAGIPASLARIFSELVTTGAMLQRLSKRKLPSLFRQGKHDPLAASMAVAEHCQALLVMGDDGANGTLSLTPEEKRLNIHFPYAHKNPALVKANDAIKRHDRKPGLDGGQYVPNPLWQLLPPDAGDVIGALPDGRVLTVHPLGGCAMADTKSAGVVDHAGRVFNPAGDGIHAGLYVMDGSIIPTALEVNPFLTIAALAWRSAGMILEETQCSESTITKVTGDDAELGPVPERQRDRPAPTGFIIQEQLTGQLGAVTPWFERHLGDQQQTRITQRDGLVIQVSASSKDAEGWLESPGRTPLRARMEFYINPLSAADVQDFAPVGVNREHLQMSGPSFLTLDGTFTLFAEDHHDWFSDHLGGLKAIHTYIKRRGASSMSFIKKEGTLLDRLLGMVRSFAVFYNIGMLQSRFRRMRYAFVDRDSGLRIQGEKVSGYSDTLGRMWPELLNLTLRIEDGPWHTSEAQLKVNTDSLLDPGLIAVRESANLPQSLLFAGGLASFFARSLLATNFWEFGGLEYPEKKVIQNTLPGVLKVGAKTVAPAYFNLKVPLQQSAAVRSVEEITLLLTRYQNVAAEPILLLHGLAQGSQIYWTDSVNNLASHFHKAGYDVWLLDYRLSNHVLPTALNRDWSIDEIARFDIPMAINRVCTETGHSQIAIFAHCVGACGLAMAALEVPGLSAKIKAVVSNAIHPWVIASPGNRFRAKLGGFYREWVPENMLEPVPQASDGALQNVLDRLAFGLARIAEDTSDDHQHYGGSAFVKGICDRMTFLYGRMWNHENLSRATHEAFKHMLGPAPISVYQHLYYFTQLRRLTDKEGENTYLSQALIQANWSFPILFIHGGDSRVFNPHSARRSARRLKESLNAAGSRKTVAVDYRIVPGYGHMDVIFGKDAHKDCFPHYVDFLRRPTDIGNPGSVPDWAEADEARPAIGPILRAAWIENKKLVLRVWCELNTNVTVKPSRLVAVGGSRSSEYRIQPVYSAPPVTASCYRFIDIEFDNWDAPLDLTLCGEIPNYQEYAGADLSYQQQAWLVRLRQMSGQQQRLCFVVGSCRFPGSIVDNALSDQIFATISKHCFGADGAQLLFLIGDQIYADATDQLFAQKDPGARYTDRYEIAFGAGDSPNFAHLVAQIPTHFALDDHEIDDNWSGLPPASAAKPLQLAAAQLQAAEAVNAAWRFMSSGRNQASIPRIAGGYSSPFYYALACPEESDFPVFVMDTRTEREFRGGKDADHDNMISVEQYQSLESWLLAAQANQDTTNAPKFIVSGSIIAPLSRQYCQEKATWRSLDGWVGYPRTLERLLAFIVAKQISKVVFVGGDAHISSVSRLRLENAGLAVVVWQIVSSGLYAPMPFANAHIEDYQWTFPHAIPTHYIKSLDIECTNKLLSDHYSQFVRVDARINTVTVTSFDKGNTLLTTTDLPLDGDVDESW